MARFLRLANTFLRQSIYANHMVDIHNIYLQTVLRNSFSSNQLKIEICPDSEADSLPSYLQPHACHSSDSVLSHVEKNRLFVSHTVSLLKTLRVQVLLKKTSLSELKYKESFNTLCWTFAKNCYQLSPSMLVSGLRSLLEIGIPPRAKLISVVEAAILKKMHFFDVTQLISCLHLHSRYLNHSTNKYLHIVKYLTESIGQQIPEISTAAEAIMIVQVLDMFDNEMRKKLEKKLVEIIQIMNIPELTRLICTISEKARRNKPLLSAAAFHMSQQKHKPKMKETVDILYALNSLNFCNSNLLSYLTENLESDIANIEQPSLISSLLKVCGQMRWRDEGVLDACGQWICDHVNYCSSREFVAFILTSAALNYVPSNCSVMECIHSHLTYESVNSEDVWLDVVWSLAVLNYLDKDMLLQVLSPDFHTALLCNENCASISNNLKLMNLKYVLKGSYPEYVFSCDLFLEPRAIMQSKESEKCRATVLCALNNLVPNDKFMCTNLSTDMGVSIDAEFIMDQKGKPLPLNLYGLKGKPSVITKPLPAGAKRIALMIWLYKDYTLNEKTLTGVNALAVQLLSAQGYIVVQVPYEEFIVQSTVVKQVVYLSHLISKSIGNTNEKV